MLGTNLSCVLGGKVISVYTRLCWVHVCVESWVVKLWYKHSVFTPGCVGYMFRLSGKVLAQAFSEYTGWCWVKIWVDFCKVLPVMGWIYSVREGFRI